ncbi:MAG: methionyl-tRNA formyltransferase [Ardenticatenaceae bacterium]|nr:methionyl-tRNA formyltransferase [Ardenticatenaceae bacterium]MCB9445387.1 methionyl-tRNA formyltransferase [Ardenticatenaceae bacterium]
MTRIVFMGTPDFAVPVLQKLIATQEIVGVVTQPDRPAGRGKQMQPPPVKETAVAANIPVYQPKSLRSEEAAAPLRQWQPDMIIVAAFGQILRPHVLDLPPLGCLNVHASLLPRWRGASPIQHAIMAGDAQTGVTLMQMDVGLDTGAMYVQQAIPIHPDETAASLHDRLAELGASMLDEYLDDIVNGRITATAQDDSLSTYAPMISKADGQLDWHKTSAELDRHIRAMTPWPGAFTYWEGQLLKVLAAEPVYGRLPSGVPGEVVRVGDTAVVLTQDGGLALNQIQLAGKRAMSSSEFLRGRPDFINSKLDHNLTGGR